MHARPVALAAALGGAYAALVRPHLLRWGATPHEAAAAYPGDELVPGASGISTYASKLPAPPAAVWRWLVQMGCDRAGFYSVDRLDNGGTPSARTIHPEWQDLAEGDRVICMPDGGAWFDVARLEREHTLVLRMSTSLAGRRFDPDAAAPPRAYTDSIWAFHLRPAPGGQTRLIVRGLGRGRPGWLKRLLDWVVWEPAHWVMQTRQFAGLRERVMAPVP